ncbi:MAG TPA: Ig-like domain-containing domain [Gemmatimonadaceae bacterium]|nr:Ig-like domain-containing domain [Gemmatimonadaceae bacterium]
MARRVTFAAAGAILGCATVQAPPGGPEDHAPPKILRVTPDTGKVNVAPKEVVFRFDEVVNERPTGAAGGLDQMVVVSPSDGAPRVSWHRDAITVRPRRNFRRNTAYTVTLLPGISDLRGNVLRTGASTFFSTGAEIPRTAVRGVVFDWVAGKPAVGALVQAFARGDTTFSWTAVTDSTGRFEIRAFPAGSYLLRGLVDANHNRELDMRELFDTVGIAIADSGRVELLAFVHDTIGPRIDKLAVEDSVTLRVDFDKPLDPARNLTTANFALLRADSTRIPIAALLTDSAFLDQRRIRDSIAADSARAARSRADTTRAAPPAGARAPGVSSVPLPRGRPRAGAQGGDTTALAKPSRPSPRSTVMVRIGAPLTPVTAYRLRAMDVRGLVGNPRTSDRVFATPKPAAADSTKAQPARPDTTRARPPRP